MSHAERAMLLTMPRSISLFFSPRRMIIPSSLFRYAPGNEHDVSLLMRLFQVLEHIGGKHSLDCLALFRHYMVDVIIASSHGYRQGALSKWIAGVEDSMATAIADFPKRGIIVRRSTLHQN